MIKAGQLAGNWDQIWINLAEWVKDFHSLNLMGILRIGVGQVRGN